MWTRVLISWLLGIGLLWGADAQATNTAYVDDLAAAVASGASKRCATDFPVVFAVNVRGTLPAWFDGSAFEQDLLAAARKGSRVGSEHLDLAQGMRSEARRSSARERFGGVFQVTLRHADGEVQAALHGWCLEVQDREIPTAFFLKRPAPSTASVAARPPAPPPAPRPAPAATLVARPKPVPTPPPALAPLPPFHRGNVALYRQQVPRCRGVIEDYERTRKFVPLHVTSWTVALGLGVVGAAKNASGDDGDIFAIAGVFTALPGSFFAAMHFASGPGSVEYCAEKSGRTIAK